MIVKTIDGSVVPVKFKIATLNIPVNRIIIVTGTNASNDPANAGGTPSGILIEPTFFSIKNLKISVVTTPTKIAANKPVPSKNAFEKPPSIKLLFNIKKFAIVTTTGINAFKA